ncbi:MAG: DUF3870 domain-containing protein [Firmicutes bacterium]|nr:DUF3870 domain-containing protein [Bacillota bacterium]MBQ8591042.1 DUF3870 domain-containing protein [Bacillota bacterium]
MRNKDLDQREVLLTGFARLPEKSVIFNKYNGAMVVAMRVIRTTGEIVDIESADLSAMDTQYLRELLCGEEILTDHGMERIEQLLSRNFQSSLRKPFYSGIRACKQKLEELLEDDSTRSVV